MAQGAPQVVQAMELRQRALARALKIGQPLK
jgi:hypothetical protein